MKKLFGYADEYVRQSDWKDLALIKLCLCSMGMIIGLSVPGENVKKPALFGAIAIFIATYIPLMARLFNIIDKDRKC